MILISIKLLKNRFYKKLIFKKVYSLIFNSIVIICIIFALVFIAFLAGRYCAHQPKFSASWIQIICVPFFVMFVISVIYKAPWFWYVIQFVMQIMALTAGINFERNPKK